MSKGKLTDRITIILITKNRTRWLAQCLSSIICQTYQNWNMLILDDSNEDITKYDNIKFLIDIASHQGNKIDIYTDMKGICQCWQKGMEMSETELCLRMEDDVVLNPNYLINLYLEIIQSDDIAAVGGMCPNPGHYKVIDPVSEEFPSGIRKEIRSDGSIFYEPYDNQQNLIKEPRVYEVCHLHGLFLFRKSLVEKVGGFATWMSFLGHRDETDLTLRLYFAGYKLLVTTRALLWHGEAGNGGSRGGMHRNEARNIKAEDEKKFQDRIKTWIAEHPNRHLRIKDKVE
jgi:GT2 family glycosyltransferase